MDEKFSRQLWRMKLLTLLLLLSWNACEIRRQIKGVKWNGSERNLKIKIGFKLKLHMHPIYPFIS